MLHNTEVADFKPLSSKYISLSRGCLAAGDFITNSGLGVIDTLLIIAVYHFSAEDPTDPHKAWVLLGVALKLAVGVGTLV